MKLISTSRALPLSIDRIGRLAFLLLLLFPVWTCQVVDAFSALLPQPPAPPLQVWELQEFAVDPAWTEEDREVPLVLAAVPEVIPANHILTRLPAAGNQGPQLSGTAWAAGYVAMTYLQTVRHGRKDYVCSPAFIHNQLADQPGEGVDILASLDLLKELGCPHERFMPYRPGDSKARPGQRAMEDAQSHLVEGFARVEYWDESQVKAHLLQNSVIIASIKISENFLTLHGPLWTGPAGRDVGNQTVAVVGYDDEKRTVWIQNSAGPAWGQYGRTAMPFEWFTRLCEKAYVLW